jgi:hypothetical protein
MKVIPVIVEDNYMDQDFCLEDVDDNSAKKTQSAFLAKKSEALNQIFDQNP